MEVYKLEEFKGEVTVLSSGEGGTQQGEAPGVRAAKSSEFREGG